ncbi:hypothetical protein PABG_11345 [Paracoccidioides brasiliensis Pb03]|nr:hypothetical protein PABG_11345 [Paracoccidioides brasiliensis Pb03]
MAVVTEKRLHRLYQSLLMENRGRIEEADYALQSQIDPNEVVQIGQAIKDRPVQWLTKTGITEKRREDRETDEEYDREGVRMGEGEEEKDGEDDAEEKDSVDGERRVERG